MTARDRPANRPGHVQIAFESLFRNSPEGILMLDNDGRIIDANPAFEAMFGYSRADVLGRDVDDIVVPRGQRRLGAEITRKVLSGETSVHEALRQRADGTEIRVSVVGAPMTVGALQAGAFAMYRDVTLRYRVQDRLADAFIDLVETISRAMESVDPYTASHQRRVAKVADMVGEKLGLDDDALQGLYVGAMLHDIGKLSIPSVILTKPGALSEQEWNMIRTHPLRGHAILADAHLPWPVADMALQHHERLDGSGYPHGVSGDGLGREVRILAACDVVEAMSSNRPYRPALPIETARQEMENGRGSRFDPEVATTIIELIDSGYIQETNKYEGLADQRL